MGTTIDFSQTLQQLLTQFLVFLPSLLASLVIFFASLFFAGFISNGVKKGLHLRKIDYEITLAIGAIARWTVIILGTSAALSQVGFDLTAFLAGVGIVGFTVGFALQDVSKNFIAGLLLLIQQPFNMEDAIDVAGFAGTVKKVDLRATTLRTFDGRIVQIPNGDVFTRAIVNYSRAKDRRIDLQVGISYDADLERARSVGLEALNSIEGVLTDPAPRAVYQTLGDFSVVVIFYYWVDTTTADLLNVQDSGVVGLNNAFKKAGIDLPFPTQVVYNRDFKG